MMLSSFVLQIPRLNRETTIARNKRALCCTASVLSIPYLLRLQAWVEISPEASLDDDETLDSELGEWMTDSKAPATHPSSAGQSPDPRQSILGSGAAGGLTPALSGGSTANGEARGARHGPARGLAPLTEVSREGMPSGTDTADESGSDTHARAGGQARSRPGRVGSTQRAGSSVSNGKAGLWQSSRSSSGLDSGSQDGEEGSDPEASTSDRASAPSSSSLFPSDASLRLPSRRAQDSASSGVLFESSNPSGVFFESSNPSATAERPQSSDRQQSGPAKRHGSQTEPHNPGETGTGTGTHRHGRTGESALRQTLYIQMEFCPRTLAELLEARSLEDPQRWQVGGWVDGVEVVLG